MVKVVGAAMVAPGMPGHGEPLGRTMELPVADMMRRLLLNPMSAPPLLKIELPESEVVGQLRPITGEGLPSRTISVTPTPGVQIQMALSFAAVTTGGPAL